jgi:hypothetical protein
MASAPLVAGPEGEDPHHPRGRIFRTRVLMLTAALVMSVLVVASVYVVVILVPEGGLVDTAGTRTHRALSYLAHGEQLRDNAPGWMANPMFGAMFGTFYDLSAVLILCLAGATATISLRDMVPTFLARFGMQLEWANRVGLILHLFNILILVVTLAFRASVEAQQGAYATSVLALLLTASFAGYLDVKHRFRGRSVRWAASLPFALATLLFLIMVGLIVIQNPSGVAIACIFVVAVFVTALLSRWFRATELRFQGFAFADDASKLRWEEMCRLEFQVLVPHQPGHMSLEEKDACIRRDHRLGPDVPILFLEVEVGDPSDFYQRPLLCISCEEGRNVIRVTRCTSVAHVIAAVGLAFHEVGTPPEIHFGWSNESAHSANLGFLLFGHGNIPWIVRELILKAEPDSKRQPRVLVG